MNILGINCYGHDSAAALLQNGKLIAAIEEERFVRQKHIRDFPINAINECLNIGNIKANELDAIAFYWNHHLYLGKQILHILKYFPTSLNLINSRTDKSKGYWKIKSTIKKRLGIKKKIPIHLIEHPLCHMASAFNITDWDKAAILSIDGIGEWSSVVTGIGEGLNIQKIKETYFPHSLGLLYNAVTDFLGFKVNSGEGKVMGLSSYGDRKKYLDTFKDMVELLPEGNFKLNLDYFEFHRYGKSRWVSKKFYNIFGEPRIAEGEITQRDMDIAAGLQEILEISVIHIVKWLYEKTKLDKLVIGGGVGLNSVMNGRLLKETPFNDLFIQPAANDAGTSLGAAFYLYNNIMQKPRNYVINNCYWGPEYSDTEIEKALKLYKLEYRKDENVCKTAAKFLSEGKIIGWYQGRMEFGPRALGNRSILSPTFPAEMKDILNARVKHRESFRPFAPVVLEEKLGEYFDCDYPAPYMLKVYYVKEDKRNVIPAVTHVDGTGRVQTINRKQNQRYYDLIDEYQKLTGVSVILNTSFNIRGEPIVCKPDEAIECFVRNDIDCLVIGDYVVEKS